MLTLQVIVEDLVTWIFLRHSVYCCLKLLLVWIVVNVKGEKSKSLIHATQCTLRSVYLH